MAPLGTRRPPRWIAGILLAGILAFVQPSEARAQAGADSAAEAEKLETVRQTDAEIQEQKRELDSLKRQISERNSVLEKLKGREKSQLALLRETEKSLSLTIRYLRALEKRRKSVMGDLGDATSELARTAVQLDADRKRLAWRLREIYKRGRTQDLEYVLSARSFGDLVARTYYLARIAQEDRHRMEVTIARRTAVQDTRTRLEERKRELDRLKAETERQRRSQARLKQQRRRILSKIRSDKKSNEDAAKELEAASKRIQGLIAELERRRLAAQRGAPGEMPLLGDFGRNKGRLSWPVSGRVSRSFGNQTHPRFGTRTFNSGIDIEASFGTSIRAVAAGRVEYVSWIEGYGKCVIINHGGGYYTLYAHASEILVSVGKDVDAGDVVGRVGDTGSTIGTVLHFEIRKGREALNPLEWFR